MTVARVTQTEAEVMLTPDPRAVVSQVVAEVVYRAAATVRPTQVAAEVITSTRMIGASRGITIVVS